MGAAAAGGLGRGDGEGRGYGRPAGAVGDGVDYDAGPVGALVGIGTVGAVGLVDDALRGCGLADTAGATGETLLVALSTAWSCKSGGCHEGSGESSGELHDEIFESGDVRVEL